jgi:hypothetical protein
MKSFFQYCDVKDKINESAALEIAKDALGGVGLSEDQIESMTLLFQFIETAVVEKKSIVISHFKQIAGSDERLNELLDKLIDVSNNFSFIKTASTKATNKFDISSDDKKDPSSEEYPSDEDLSGKMV